MGIVRRFTDGLANLASGLGTSADKRTRSFHHLCLITPDQIDAAYRSSWLIRKIVDIPALDMTRERRDWQAEQDDISKLEAEEKRLKLWEKIKRALILGRLGGGAIILGVGNENPALPINPKSLKPGSLRYLHVVSRHRLGIGQIVTDPASDLFEQPEYFTLSCAGGQVRIHPSRVVVFRGQMVPDLGVAMTDQAFWGDSIIQTIDEAVKDATTATGGFASLIHEAKVDTVSIPGLIDLVATDEGEKLLEKRVTIANTFKSIWNTRILDGGQGDEKGEEWDTRQINWAGMPDVMNAFMGFVAGAADIPATRLLGRSPQGMNATGESDLTNYYDMITAKQDDDLRPQLEQIDQVLIPSAGVSQGDEAKTWFEFPPLKTPTEKEEADTFNVSMDAISKLLATGLVPDVALSKGVQNFMTERGYLPGLEGALAEIPEGERFLEPTEIDEEDPSALTQEGGDPSTGAKGGSPKGKVPFADYNPNRHPAGTRRGGQFAPKGSGSFASDLASGPITNAAAILALTGLDVGHLQRGARASDLNHASKFSKKGRRPPSQKVLRGYAQHAATAHSMRIQGQRGHGSGLRLRSEIKIGKRNYTLIERVGERSRSLSFVTMWENE